MATGTEIIDSEELAKRWHLPKSWIQEQTRSRAVDPFRVPLRQILPVCLGLPELNAWLECRMRNGNGRKK